MAETILRLLTNLQLVDYCEEVYRRGWVYWYGTVGYKCTQDLYERKKEQYPAYYGSSRTDGYMQDIKNGSTCADCVGLIKSFAWRDGDINALTKYDGEGGRTGCPDVSANDMYELCKETGRIDALPDIPGLCVWRKGHIGVYVGNGYTIELRGFAYDCQKRKVSDGTWTNWGKLPFIEYVGSDEAPKPVTYALGDRVLKRGMVGDDVKELQTDLMMLGYELPKYGADGDFGSETVTALKQFQMANDLDADGIFGTKSLKALQSILTSDNIPPASDVPDSGSAPVYGLFITGSQDWLKAIQALYGGVISEVAG